MAHSSGTVYDKAVIIEALAQEAPSDSIPLPEMHDFTVKAIEADYILVLYLCVRRSNGAKPDKTTIRSSIWRRSNGRWMMLFHQGTIVPAR